MDLIPNQKNEKKSIKALFNLKESKPIKFNFPSERFQILLKKILNLLVHKTSKFESPGIREP